VSKCFLIASESVKAAIHPSTGEIVAGFDRHVDAIGAGKKFDLWVRAVIFPARKRVYFRFYKPDGDYTYVDEADRAKSFDVCYTAWERLIKAGYCRKSWKVLYATTDKVVTEGDIKL
jgi:hypothetical protein